MDHQHYQTTNEDEELVVNNKYILEKSTDDDDIEEGLDKNIKYEQKKEKEIFFCIFRQS
jgi:hypothetical protein